MQRVEKGCSEGIPREKPDIWVVIVGKLNFKP